MMRRMRAAGRRALLAAAVLGLTAGCSLAGNDGSNGGEASTSKQVVLVTHDSFALPKKLISDFERRSGYQLVVRASGDAGTLTTKLAITAGDPTGDVAFGVDNTFGSRALDAGVFAAYDALLPAGAAQYRLPGDTDHRLTPIDNGNVCVNVDTTWFAAHHQRPPATLDDLTRPAYKDLFVAPGAATSSTGLAFLLTTVAAMGDRWPDYWTALLDNGLKLTDGWTGAYEDSFTQGGGHGTRPIVLSYDSSPAFTVSKGTSTTEALLDTCFRQVEYAGVLAGAANTTGARAFIDFLLSTPVQDALPDSMYVFPVSDAATLPAEWAKFAVQPTHPWSVDPAEIAQNRDEWLTTWQDVVSR